MATHPFQNVRHVARPEAFLDQVGTVFRTFGRQDSGCVSYGVLVCGQRWFVKTASTPKSVASLRSAIAFRVRREAGDGSAVYRADATWCPVRGADGVRLSASNYQVRACPGAPARPR
ncbi:AbfB domain-containing protein [Streptomyces sp. NPDC096040]|uniref:AbfB domain-containing protein n=1 Tax=Streptomyces sp. NPDC096040 TaxID=3155541 RepID=UPI00331ADB90